MKLSILILTIPNRVSLSGAVIREVTAQSLGKPVEVLWLGDNKTMTIGEKRNKLLSIARGDYVVFIDDDDRISADYVSLLLAAQARKPDVIVFHAEYTENGKNPKPVYYDIAFGRDINHADHYDRIPNHICCVRRDYAVLTRYKPISYGEDADYAQRLLPRLKTQSKINKVLYYYDFNSETSESG